MRRLPAMLLPVVLAVPGVLPADTGPADAEKPAAPPEPRVEFVDGRLSVEAKDVPMMDLLGRIADATGAKVAGSVDDPGSVTVSFDDVPVRQAIDRIVGQRNFTLRYGGDGSLRRITLRGRSLDLPEAAPVPSPRARARFQRLWARHPPVPLTGSLKQALKADAVPLPRLLRSVRRLNKRPLRRQAVARFVEAIETDEKLRKAWRAIPPKDLARFMKLQTGKHARESLVFIVASTKDAKARQHAGAAIREVPQARVGGR